MGPRFGEEELKTMQFSKPLQGQHADAATGGETRGSDIGQCAADDGANLSALSALTAVPGLLGAIFERQPAAQRVFTIARCSREWHAWAVRHHSAAVVEAAAASPPRRRGCCGRPCRSCSGRSATRQWSWRPAVAARRPWSGRPAKASCCSTGPSPHARQAAGSRLALLQWLQRQEPPCR